MPAPLPHLLIDLPDDLPNSFNGSVHLWLLDVRNFGTALVQQAQQIMSNDEHERAAKFIRGKDEYVASRWLLRRVLGLYTRRFPEQVTFERTDKCKPFMPGSSILFNLSHSGDWVVVAVSNGIQVGVDVEQGNYSRDLAGIASHYFHPQEYLDLQAQPAEAQPDYFYQLWTLKEALLKGLGVGIAAGLEKIRFTVGRSIKVDIASTLEAPSLPTGWHFHHWRLPNRSYCSLASAYERPPAIAWFDTLKALADGLDAQA